MKDDVNLDALVKHLGIVPSFRDLTGIDRPTSQDTKLALLRANGVDTSTSSSIACELEWRERQIACRICDDEYILEAESASEIQISATAEWSLALDKEHTNSQTHGGRASSKIDLPPLPAGIHTLFLTANGETQSVTIIAAPNKAPSVMERTKQPRIWGVNTALYGLHSKHTQGIGSYEDLALASEATASLGVSFLGINPVHSIGWAEEQIISPYSPSHRGYLNTDHIHLSALNELTTRAAEISGHIDYRAHRTTHHVELENAFLNFQNCASDEERLSYLAYKKGEGTSLDIFALFEALSEIHGPDWRVWPFQFQNSDSPAVSNFAAERKSRIEFHIWLQWLANEQLTRAQSRAIAAGMQLGLYLDLAVGARRGGAETWCESSVVAQGVSIGAPPDHLTPAGQNWNLAAFAPSRLKQTQYSSFRSILKHALSHAGILRIDHVLGLNRSFWIPDDGTPGGYIRQPFEALLAVVAIEAQKNGTIIVGEDLGLVPDGLRKRLHERGLYSYSVLQYEKDENGKFKKPNNLQENSLTCFSTHDTPTLHGYLQQRDIDWWARLGWIDETSEHKLRAARQKEIGELLDINNDEEYPAEQTQFRQLSYAIHGALANSQVTMISVQLDDALGAIEAQNLPGTVDEHVNWQRRTSIPIESFSTNADLGGIAQQMNNAKRSAL